MSDYDDDFDDESPKKPAASWLQPVTKPAARSPSPVKKEKVASPYSARSRTPSSRRSSPRQRYSSRSSSRSSRRSSPRRRASSTSDLASPAKTWDASPQHAAAPSVDNGPTPVKEIAILRLKNAELQRAIDAVRTQLSKIAPRLSANVKRKHSNENERMNRLQQEAAILQQEQSGLMKKLRDVEHVKELEKQLANREAEVKTLQERNKFLQLEIRNNAKKLKQAAAIEEHRAQVLNEIKQERKLAITALEKAQRDAELAVQSKETAQKRLAALEARDRLPELKPEDVKQLLDMKTALNEKIETIESLQYRLSVLKRAHESVHRTIVANPAELAEVETLKAEVAALRTALAQADSRSQKEPPKEKEAKRRVDKSKKTDEKSVRPADSETSQTPPAQTHHSASAGPTGPPESDKTEQNAEAERARQEEEKARERAAAARVAEERAAGKRRLADIEKQEAGDRAALVKQGTDDEISLQARERHDRSEIANRKKPPVAGRRASQSGDSEPKPVATPSATQAQPQPAAAAKPAESTGPSWLDE